jgi:hypothetical protein
VAAVAGHMAECMACMVMVTSIIDLREDSSIGDYLIASTVGVGVGIGVGAAMTILGAATTLLWFFRKRSPRRQLAQLILRPVTGNSRSSQSRPQGAERDLFRS